MTGKQEGPYKGEETKAEEDKVWHREDLMDVAYIKQSGSELRMQCVVCN